MPREQNPTPRLKAPAALILIAIFVAGIAACGPTSQTTKPDESSDSEEGYGGYRY